MNTASWLFSCLLVIVITSPLVAQTAFPSDPSSASIHTEDITRFWKIFDETKPGFDGRVFQEKYLDAGSEGLKGFIRMRIESGKNLSKTIKQNLAYYEQIRESSLSIDSRKDTLFRYFQNFKSIYPAAVFPDVYFVIGAKNTGGTTFAGGLIIGAETFGQETPTLKPRQPIGSVNLVVVHELIHFQQDYIADNTLLAQSIKEGAADFLCELITGSHPNLNIHAFGNSRENELWQEFKGQMNSKDWTPWLYRTTDKTRPQDLGYWVGYKISKAYYDKVDDKQAAIHDLLHVSDFPAFLSKSGYDGK